MSRVDANRWQRLQELYRSAIELPAERRKEWLADACPDDPELLREAESLVLHDDRPTGIRDAIRDAAANFPAAGEPAPGDRLGPYRIVRVLGSGGMGTVFLAERDDDQYRKTVAIKLVRSGLLTAETLARFKAERQILANLDHPNIARLVDGGVTENGLPYLVMEYVDGIPIHHFCDRNRLPVKQRLSLFIDVCGAVEYAHRNLVVHRDIKPGNILVTPAGVPKLLDFGIAKLLSKEDGPNDPGLTQAGAHLLTPDYASPEQVKGQPITTATDVYALGLLLYQLMTGGRPYHFADASLAAMQTAICEAEPAKLSRAVLAEREARDEIAKARRTNSRSLGKELAGDLDNIVLTALRKEPERRYATVGELAGDVRRHLQGLPVRASEDSWSYRAGKFVRRHKLGVAFSSLFLLTVTGFAATVWVQNGRIARQRDAALTERRKAEETVSFFLDLFRLADPGETKGNAITAREVLDQGAERIRTELNDQPDVQASMMEAIAQVYSNLGLDEKAAPLLRDALETRRRISGEHSTEYARTLRMTAQSDFNRGRYPAARVAAERALALWTEVGGEGSAGYGEALLLNARIDDVQHRFDSAELMFRRCLELYGRLYGNDSLEIAEVMNDYGVLLYESKKYAESERLQRQALAIRQKRLDRVNPNVAESLNNLAIVLSDTAKYDDARKVLQQALEVDRKVYGEIHPNVGTDLNNLGMVEYLTHHYDAADRYLRQALEVRRQAVGTRHPDYAISLSNLSKNLMDMKQYAEAESLQRQALQLNRELYGEASPPVAACWNMLGAINYTQHRWSSAEAAFRGAMALYPRMKGTHTSEMAASTMGLGRVLLQRGELAEAEGLLREALRLRTSIIGPGHWQVAWMEAVLADCLARRGNLEEARSLALSAEPVIREQRGEGGIEYGLVRKVLAEVSGENTRLRGDGRAGRPTLP